MIQKLKTGKIEKIKQRLVYTTPVEILIQNKTRRNILLEFEESLDGVRPKILVKIRDLKRKLKRKNDNV
jgi:hypothetical protein